MKSSNEIKTMVSELLANEEFLAAYESGHDLDPLLMRYVSGMSDEDWTRENVETIKIEFYAQLEAL